MMVGPFLPARYANTNATATPRAAWPVVLYIHVHPPRARTLNETSDAAPLRAAGVDARLSDSYPPLTLTVGPPLNSGFFMWIGFVVAERIMFMPSIGE